MNRHEAPGGRLARGRRTGYLHRVRQALANGALRPTVAVHLTCPVTPNPLSASIPQCPERRDLCGGSIGQTTSHPH
jgi:hypothetical protein